MAVQSAAIKGVKVHNLKKFKKKAKAFELSKEMGDEANMAKANKQLDAEGVAAHRVPC